MSNRCGVLGWTLVVGLAIMASATMPWPAEAASAKITAITLKVTHRVGAAGSWQASKVGTQLPPNSRVRTAKRSICEIKFPDGSRVRMGPRSDLVISDPATKQLKVVTGQVFANIVSGTGAQIQGATATAAVKGTWVLYQGPTAPGEYPPRDFDWVSAWFGSVEFGNEQGSSTVGDGQSSNAPAGMGPSAPGTGFHHSFGGGTLFPWWEQISSGTETSATPGTPAGVGFKEEQVGARTQTKGFVGGPTTGAVDVVVQSNPALSIGGGGNGALLAAGALAAASLGQISEERVLGRAFFGPSSQLDLMGVLVTGGALGGARARAAGLYGHYYGEIGLQALTDFAGEGDTSVSDLFVVDRVGRTDIVLGRQRYLEGPVNNSPVGSLFGVVRFDGVSVQRRTDDWSAMVAWLDEYEAWGQSPLQTGGWFGRVSAPVLGGQVGVNALRQQGESLGLSADVCVPVIPGYLDVYTELGDDPTGAHLETFGVYFPELYQSAGLDVYVEHASRHDQPSLWSALAYLEAGEGWTGLGGARKVQGDNWEFALGAIKRFGTLAF